MDDYQMVNLLGWSLSIYKLSIIVGCLGALGVFLWQGRKLKGSAKALTVLLGIVLGLFFARLYYVAARFELFAEIGWENFFRATDPDYASWGAVNGANFWGAVGGVCLAALLAGKITEEKVSSLLDALAPAAALGIAISRFGEYSIGEGIGPDVESEALQFFPLAVANKWEEWNYALFLLEGLAAVVIFIWLMTRGGKLKDGYRARAFLILYSACQIIFEALRRDNFLRWLFVRVCQLNSALVLLGLIVFGVLRWAKHNPASRMSTKSLVIHLVVFALMVPVIIVMEFDVDKDWLRMSRVVDYLIEMAAAGVMGVMTWRIAMKN